MISKDDDGFYGVNFYKADNTTPLGVHNTCPTTTFVDNSINPDHIATISYAVPDLDNGGYKTIFGGWW